MKMKVYIAGEDDATKAIIKKVLLYCSNNFEIILDLPARGGLIKSKIAEFNKLSETAPVILLIDLDAKNCAPELLNELIVDKNENLIFNIAVDEAEAWLMADREGFAEYFKINLEDMPCSHKTKQNGGKELTEMDFSVKSSWYLTHKLVDKIRKPEYIQQLTPKKGATKGPEYNSCIIPFIENKWNIDNAQKNTDSLNRMINRIKKLDQSAFEKKNKKLNYA